MVAHSSEFENIVVRDEEQNELEKLAQTSCPLEVKGGPSNKHGKVSILIQVILFVVLICYGKYFTTLGICNLHLSCVFCSCIYLGVQLIPFL